MMKIINNKLRCDTELVCKYRLYCIMYPDDYCTEDTREEEQEDDKEEKENNKEEEEEEGDALFQRFERLLFPVVSLKPALFELCYGQCL